MLAKTENISSILRDLIVSVSVSVFADRKIRAPFRR